MSFTAFHCIAIRLFYIVVYFKLFMLCSIFSYNRRKLDELPFQYYQLNASQLPVSPYLTDISWIYTKVCGSNCFEVLEDIALTKASGVGKFAEVIEEFLEQNACALNYDGRQFYSHLYSFLLNVFEQDPSLKLEVRLSELLEICKRPPVPSLIPLAIQKRRDQEDGATYGKKIFTMVTRLPETEQYVVTVSTDKEEICVWDIKR